MPLTKSDTVPINGRRLAIYRKASTQLRQPKLTVLMEHYADIDEEVPDEKIEAIVPSQYDLAEASHVSRSYISEIEKGLKQPSYLVAKALADAIGVGVDDLIS